MKWLILSILAFCTLSLALPGFIPVKEAFEESKTQEISQSDKRQILDDVEFLGIDWSQALNESVCTAEKVAILLQTVKNVWDWFSLEPIRAGDSTQVEWERFFGGRETLTRPQPHYSWFGDSLPRGQEERAWVAVIQGTYRHIKNAMQVARRYPSEGNSRKPNRKVRFLCQNAEAQHGHCNMRLGMRAYTKAQDVNWPDEEFALPYTISFCNAFFRSRYLEEILEEGPIAFPALYQRSYPALNVLLSFEHILYHEYMHVRWFGYSKKIVDMVDSLRPDEDSGVNIYGAQPASAYARKYYDSNSSVNPSVAINADNFAWYATNLQVRKAWGEDLDPFNFLDGDEYPHLPKPGNQARKDASAPLEKRQEVNDDDDDDAAAFQDLHEWPRNCVWGTKADDTWVCYGILDDYDEWVAEALGTTLSPQCQNTDPEPPFEKLNAVAPDCTCIDNETREERRLFSHECRGFVGVLVGCRENGRGGCSCYTNLNDGPHYVNKRRFGVEDCSSLSRGLTNEDVNKLINS